MTDSLITDTLGFIAHRVDASHDDQQKQIDALEQLVLNRTALVDIQQDGRKVQFTFTRRGEVHRVECYADMSMNVAELRRALVEN